MTEENNNVCPTNNITHDIYKSTVTNEFIANVAEKFNVSFDKVKADVEEILKNNSDSIDEDDFLETLELALENKYAKNTYLGITVPKPFSVKNDTLFVEKLKGTGDDAEYVQMMISRGFIVKSIGEIQDKGDFESIRYVELAWKDINGNEKSDLFQTNYILEPSLQKEYLKHLDIAGNKRTDIIDYYQKMLMNNEIPIKEITKVGGWKDNFTRYVTADETYGSDAKYMLLENQSMENVHKKGTFNDWIEGSYQLLSDEVFAFVTYTGVCTLIQRYLGIPNFNILFINESSIGKTTSAKERSSVFGNPHHMMTTSNASKQGIPNVIYAYNDTPAHIDEIKDEDIQTVRKFFYDVSSGQKRIVANKYGGVRNTKNDIYNINVIYTTEQQIFDASVSMGQLARTITILRTPKTNLDGVKAFEKYVCDKNGNARNYGHCVEFLVPKVMEMIQDGTLKSRYDEITKEIRSSNMSNSNMVNRLIDYYAGIALAGEIFNTVIVNHPENKGRIKALNPLEISKEFMQEYMQLEPDKSEGERAIEVLMDWYSGNKYRFNEPEQIAYNVNGETEYRDQKVTFFGYDTDEHVIYIFNNVVKDVLIKAGFNYDTIIGKWKEQGYIVTKKDKSILQKALTSEHQKMLGKKNFTCIAIVKDKIKNLIIGNQKSKNEDLFKNFCDDKLVIGNAIIESTLKEIYDDYVNWCNEKSISHIKKLEFHNKFVLTYPTINCYQDNEDDINTISYICVGLKDTNYSKPTKLILAKIPENDDSSVSA